MDVILDPAVAVRVWLLACPLPKGSHTGQVAWL